MNEENYRAQLREFVVRNGEIGTHFSEKGSDIYIEGLEPSPLNLIM